MIEAPERHAAMTSLSPTCAPAVDVGPDGVAVLVCAEHRIELDGPREGHALFRQGLASRTCPVTGQDVIPELEEDS